MSAPAIKMGPRLSPEDMAKCDELRKQMIRIIAPAAAGNDLYALCAQDALNGLGVTEEQLNEMRREGARG